MKFSLPAAVLALAGLLPSATAAQGDLLARMSAVNSGLHSYTASVDAHVKLTVFPYLQTDLAGKLYHKDPDLNKVEFTSGLPGVAQQFGKLYPRIEPPSRWNDVFKVTMVSDDGKTAHFRLEPRKEGNVSAIDATVDDASATVASMTWHYNNGGTAEMSNSYSTIKGYRLVTSQSGMVDEPQYKGTITSRISNYAINPPLSDSVFASQ